MLNWLYRLFGTAGESASNHVEYEPVYGLPKGAVEEWLARNPRIKQEYEAELERRKLASSGRDTLEGGSATG